MQANTLDYQAIISRLRPKENGGYSLTTLIWIIYPDRMIVTNDLDEVVRILRDLGYDWTRP